MLLHMQNDQSHFYLQNQKIYGFQKMLGIYWGSKHSKAMVLQDAYGYRKYISKSLTIVKW